MSIDSTNVLHSNQKTDSFKKDVKVGQKEEVVKEKKAPTELQKATLKPKETNSGKADAKPQEAEKPEEVNSVKTENLDKKKNLLINNSKNQESPNGKQQ